MTTHDKLIRETGMPHHRPAGGDDGGLHRPYRDYSGNGLRQLRRARAQEAVARGQELAKLVQLWRTTHPLDKRRP